MESSYQIFPDQNLIRTVVKGRAEMKDLARHIDMVNADPSFRPGMNTIADMSDAILAWDYREMDRFRTYLKEVELRRGACKWAIICHGEITVSSARLFIIMYETWSPLIQIKMFGNDADGTAWINSGQDDK